MNWNAFVWVKCSDEFKMDSNWKWVEDLKGVKKCWSAMGDWDLWFQVDVNSPDELESWVWTELRKNRWVTDTRSTWTKEVWSS